MISRIATDPRRHFLKTGIRHITARDGKVFRFQLERDRMVPGKHYITVAVAKPQIAHFDFNITSRWMVVQYGTFATTHPSVNYSDWSTSCLKDLAIEVAQPWRATYRGIGTTMVSLALQWGRRNELSGMRIIQPQTPKFWRKLSFTWQEEDLVFCFASQPRAPQARITWRK